MARITETLENQKILMWHWGRGKGTSIGGPGNNRKLSFVLDNVKIEKTYTFWYLTFIDPFTGKEVKIRKNPRNVQFIDPEKSNGGIKWFEGFTDRPKRPKKKAPVEKLNPPRPWNIGGVGVQPPQVAHNIQIDETMDRLDYADARQAEQLQRITMTYDPLVAQLSYVDMALQIKQKMEEDLLYSKK